MAGRLVASGAEIERATGGQRIRRHHHERAYAALLLSGGYLEAGDQGRMRVEAGDVLFHAAFDGHANCIGVAGAQILNLPLTCEAAFACGTCVDPDSVARLAERDLHAAAALLLQIVTPTAAPPLDWPDVLALEFRNGVAPRLDAWAAARGLSPSAVSHGFKLAYGVSPKRFRMEQRAAAAARAIKLGERLAMASATAGFADQPHMTRTVAELFGRTPGQLRN